MPATKPTNQIGILPSDIVYAPSFLNYLASCFYTDPGRHCQLVKEVAGKENAENEDEQQAKVERSTV